MKKLDNAIAKFLEDWIEEIDSNNFNKIYTMGTDELWAQCDSPELLSDLTLSFLECGIDPLTYLGYIPEAYFSCCDKLISFCIPNHITLIKDTAFYKCANLEKVFIPKSVKTIGDDAFNNCHKLEILYEGSKRDWDKVHKYFYSNTPIPVKFNSKPIQTIIDF